jgi:hypothetical protein
LTVDEKRVHTCAAQVLTFILFRIRIGFASNLVSGSGSGSKLAKIVPKKGGKCKTPCFEELSRGLQASFGARRFFRGFLMQIFPTVNFSYILLQKRGLGSGSGIDLESAKGFFYYLSE